ncbi:pantoate--beta-alanine ligase [Peredibacter sp. HCB2-198]|uniref:pantoate--beta-alanine ligase n=1 Tax=Peredibacter sp. HCB2-198 TaxID=3383025 RepID=UPI0038B56857
MVTLVRTTQELNDIRNKETRPVGFVPTMGNLHQGHISLLERALTEYEVVYFSIFVNPKQFGPNEDFNRYPRTLEHDINLITELAKRFPNKEVVVYSPKDPQEVFPESKNQNVSVLGLSTMLEGKIRPGHFDGVATVVYRLFELTRPTSAYFGLKDYQQYLVIRQMVKDLQMPIKIIGMPIIRENEGLALSSRNQYLSPEQKSSSLLISRTLNELKKILNHKRENLLKAQSFISDTLKDPNWNYLEMRDAETLSEDVNHSKQITILAVYQMGTTRLLDNTQVEIQ